MFIQKDGKRLIVPPFTEESARAKVQAAEDAWNSRDPKRVSLAYTEDSQWRNRSEFFQGREAIQVFLIRKWSKELNYKLKKEYWAHVDNRITVRFEYEYQTQDGDWFRAYGIGNLIFFKFIYLSGSCLLWDY